MLIETDRGMFEIPDDIVRAAQSVAGWFKRRYIKTWELLDVCSRDYAYGHTANRATVRRLSQHNSYLLQELHKLGWVDPQPEQPSADEMRGMVERERVVKMQKENSERSDAGLGKPLRELGKVTP